MKRVIVDLSSVIWNCLMASKDPEFGREVEWEGKKFLVNSAGWGFDNAQNQLTGMMKDLDVQPHQLIFVKEGDNSKAGRQALYGGYKNTKDKCPDQYAEFGRCRDMVLDVFTKLGSNVCWQDGVEGDDVIGYLAQHLKGEVWIFSHDKDLGQCIGGNVHLLRRGMKDENPFGPFSPKNIAAYIAVVGDSADKIPGAKGFGPKAAEELLIRFGDEGLSMLDELIRKKQLSRLAEDVAEMKSLQKIIDSAEMVYTSYELARLRTEKVNTLRHPLQWRVGMVANRALIEDSTYRKWAGQQMLVHAGNYQQAYDHLKRHLWSSPFFALDIETSTPPESDEWLELQDKEEKVVDVMGSELTGLSLIYGPNLQYTLYITVDHVETDTVKNVTREQIRDLVGLLPAEKINWVHNNSFELPVLYNTWGKDWEHDPVYHGFLRNVRDTAIASSYVDENLKRGLKSLSKHYLGYEQTTYEEVTTREYLKADWVAAGAKGRVLAEWRPPVPTGRYGPPVELEEIDEGTGLRKVVPGDEIFEDGPSMVKVQHKMNQLTAAEVLAYGADDAICTAALANFFTIIMEIEDTYNVFEEVETWPAYLTALGFVQGADFDLEEMLAMEKEDEAAEAKAWATLRQYLIDVGFEGTVCPVYEEIDAASIKQAFQFIGGKELRTQVRTPGKLAKLIEMEVESDPELPAALSSLAEAVKSNDLGIFNRLVAEHFKGEPKLDLGSPKQMKSFLYEFVGMPIRMINDVTPTEKDKEPLLADAAVQFARFRRGKASEPSPEQYELLRKKAKTDDTAIDYALAFDADSLSEASKAALKAVGAMKKVMTRRNLFYKNYLRIRHWKTGKIHAQANQCAAVTRRYSMSNPNLQQLPKKGEGVKFRGCFKPHHKDAVIVSIDFSGQELRLAAWRSQDPNMLACYVGDNLKDLHSITAASAMKLKWGADAVKEAYGRWGQDLAEGMDYDLFLRLRALGKSDPMGKKADDLRKESKNVNFAAQFGGQAVKLSETLIMKVEDAQLFLDARSEMFPDVDRAAKRAAEFAEKNGYALTLMGARRHLRNSIMSTDKREISAALRQAWNMEIQGSAGEMSKLAMGRIWNSGIFFRFDAHFFAPIHDELVASVHKDHALEFIRIMHECMTQPYAGMEVPVLGSISVGPDFANQIECGDWFIAENIQAAVNDIFNVKEAA